MIGESISHYKITAKIGEGGMGEVYQASDTKLRRKVALKFLPSNLSRNDDARKRFVREAQAASALQHQNICTIHDIDETDEGQVYICMEYCDGETLGDRIARGPLPLDDALEITRQIAGGLSRAHDTGIVHRDIKPANIVVTRDGTVKILDFGLATLAGAAKLTKTGMTVGTAAYMSPEQATGQDVDHRSDIWSVGVVLYEMLSGETPFKADHEHAVIYRILHEDSQPLSRSRSDVPDRLSAVIARALRKSRDERYQTLSEFLSDLNSLTEATAGSRTIPGDSDDAGKRAVRENRRPVAVLPFKILSGDAEYAFLSLALAEAVSHGLSANPELIVRPTSAVMKYAEENVAPTVVARELGVAVVVEGSIQKIGSEVRVQVQAWDTVAGATLLSVKLDGRMDDLFGLQDRVAEALGTAMGVGEHARPAAQPGPHNAHAYELYLRASERLMRYSKADTHRAIEMLRSAVERDPRFSGAWARLAAALVNMGALFDPDPNWYVEAETAVTRALALDSMNPEAWSAKGRMLWSQHHGFQHAPALRNLHKACCLPGCPIDAPLWKGLILSHIGLHDEALQVAHEVREAQPDDPMVALLIGETLGYNGDLQGFLEVMRETIRLDPAFYYTHIFLPIPLLYLGELGEAESAIRSGRGILGNDAMLHAGEALLWAKRGEHERADKHLHHAIDNLQSVSHAHHTYHIAAAAAAALGDRSRTVELLGRAISAGLPNYPAFMNDPHFAPFHKLPEFAQLMTELKAVWESHRVEFGGAAV